MASEEIEQPGPEWRRNPGRKPRGLDEKRVAVMLRNGRISGDKPVTPTSPAGWPVDGKGKCRWTLDDPKFPRDFDIIWFRVL